MANFNAFSVVEARATTHPFNVPGTRVYKKRGLGPSGWTSWLTTDPTYVPSVNGPYTGVTTVFDYLVT